MARTCSPGSMGRAGDKTDMQMMKKSRWVCSRHQQGPITDRVPTTQWVTWAVHRAATFPSLTAFHPGYCTNHHFH